MHSFKSKDVFIWFHTIDECDKNPKKAITNKQQTEIGTGNKQHWRKFYTALQIILKSRQNVCLNWKCVSEYVKFKLKIKRKILASTEGIIKTNTIKLPYTWMLACFWSERKTCTAKPLHTKAKHEKKGMFTFIKRFEWYVVKSMPETNTLKTKKKLDRIWTKHSTHCWRSEYRPIHT